jgi:hypothetical protein
LKIFDDVITGFVGLKKSHGIIEAPSRSKTFSKPEEIPLAPTDKHPESPRDFPIEPPAISPETPAHENAHRLAALVFDHRPSQRG